MIRIGMALLCGAVLAGAAQAAGPVSLLGGAAVDTRSSESTVAPLLGRGAGPVATFGGNSSDRALRGFGASADPDGDTATEAATGPSALIAGSGTSAMVATSGATTGGASLFRGTAGAGFFAPRPAAAAVMRGRYAPRDRLLDLIAKAEAGRAGYDAVQHGATIRPPAPPTALTIAQIYDWIDATPGQPHAIGRYQFIPPTLRRLVARTGVDPSARFTPQVQDRLAHQLLVEAGMLRFKAGEISRDAFMLGLARIWAGLPTASGRSYYHGFAGNKATISRAKFEAEMAVIFPR